MGPPLVEGSQGEDGADVLDESEGVQERQQVQQGRVPLVVQPALDKDPVLYKRKSLDQNT